ncbi:MAG: hypothetical protein AAF433_22590 [Bacteroidota bacterium]
MQKHQLHLCFKTLLLALCCSPFFGLNLQAQDCVEECECDGGLSEMTLYYFGDNNANVRVYGDLQQTQLIDQFAVTNGDDFTVSAAALAGGFFPYYLYFEVDDGMGNECTAKIFAYCPSLIWPLSEEDLEIRGKSYGPLTVFSYRSAGSGNVCDLNDPSIEQDWRVGGNLVGTDNNTMGTLNQEDVSFITGNTEQAVLTTDGRFGIGTSNPEELLDVNGKALIRNDGAAATLLGGDHVFLEFSPDGNSVAGQMGYLSSGTNSIGIENSAPGGDLVLSTDDDVLLESESVGIGVTSPATKLHVAGDQVRLSTSGALNRYLELSTDAPGLELNAANDDLSINAAGNDMALNADDLELNGDGMTLNATNNVELNADNNILLDGNSIFLNGVENGGPVAINTTNIVGDYSLYVGGTIIATEVIVKLEINWPDYVFADDYPRPNIKEWEQFILEHKHLPGMPSAAEMAERDGVAVGETQVLLLEKIEELTLLLIDQQKEIDALKAQVYGQ